MYFVYYLHIMDQIDARKVENIKFQNEVYVSQILEVSSIIQTTKTLHTESYIPTNGLLYNNVLV